MSRINIDFEGSNKTRGECESLALKCIAPEIRAREADLYLTKWFDYRLTTPVHSTYFYAHAYKIAARDYCRANKDMTRADGLKIFGHPDIFQTRDLTACTNARQALDRIGCRYEWALTWLQKRFSDRGWASFPRPNQLYSEELMMDVSDAWQEECRIALQIAHSPHFQITPGAPLQPVQREYTTWLIGQVQLRGKDAWRSLSRLLSEGVMDAATIEAHFGADTLALANSVANSAASPGSK